ncbi:protein TIFY 3-like [Vicia villosa]|uniref:protein TIFY 3-like n=1 Tax=Vicia villosa TaxID=3911 RepID=UPI00273AAC74|nr:protein TIFY 3-like [Vicia villosa]
MANTDSITNLVINSVSDAASVKNFSANWPMSSSGLNAKGQFAIYYNGSMCVYDGIPAEKVQEILMMAATTAKSSELKSGIPFTSLFTSATPSSPQGTSNNLPSPPSVCFPAADKSSICRMQEFPLARRQSLQSFFEKRRIRVRSKAPYTSSSSKEANNMNNNFNTALVPFT